MPTREHLFKAKRKDNGEWVKGSLITYKDGDCFICVEELTDVLNKYEVDPETVCEYTGLTDKNGDEIFEGDILKGFKYPFLDDEGNHNYYAKICWFDNSPAFGIVTVKNPKSEVRGISEGNLHYLENFESEMWEVIGNIYDNPELLEASK